MRKVLNPIFLVLAILVSKVPAAKADSGLCSIDGDRRPSMMDQCEGALDLKTAQRFTLDQHIESSKKRIAHSLGVAPEALSRMHAASKEFPTTTGLGSVADCGKNFSDTVAARNKYLECVSRFGQNGLDPELLSALTNLRTPRLRRANPIAEEQRSLALLAYLNDLILENQRAKGNSVAWTDPRSGQLISGKNFADFSYQPGDILLTIGDSSVSAIISQSTYPPRRYSHALIMGQSSEGQNEIYETLIETGSIKQPWEKFTARRLNTVLVLRWKDSGSDIPLKASLQAKSMAQKGIPYDSTMDFSDSTKLFCSEFVLGSYAAVLGVSAADLAPPPSEIRSLSVFNYLKNLGVSKMKLPSPGDLIALKQFEMVGEYRNSEDLVYLWGMIAMADVWMERLDSGFTLRRSVRSRIATSIGGVADLIGGIIGTDWSLVPDSLSQEAAATIMTQEDAFKRAYKFAIEGLKKKYTTRSLLDIPLWEIRGHLSFALQEDPVLRRRFR